MTAKARLVVLALLTAAVPAVAVLALQQGREAAPLDPEVVLTQPPSIELERCAIECQLTLDTTVSRCEGHVRDPARDPPPVFAPECRRDAYLAFKGCMTTCKGRFVR